MATDLMEQHRQKELIEILKQIAKQLERVANALETSNLKK